MSTVAVVENHLVPIKRESDALRAGNDLTYTGLLDAINRAEDARITAGSTQYEMVMTSFSSMGWEKSRGLLNQTAGKLTEWDKALKAGTPLSHDAPVYISAGSISGLRSIVSKYRTLLAGLFVIPLSLEYLVGMGRDAAYEECKEALKAAGIKPSGETVESFNKRKEKRETRQAMKDLGIDAEDVLSMSEEDREELKASAAKLVADKAAMKETKAKLEKAQKMMEELISLGKENESIREGVIQMLAKAGWIKIN